MFHVFIIKTTNESSLKSDVQFSYSNHSMYPTTLTINPLNKNFTMEEINKEVIVEDEAIMEEVADIKALMVALWNTPIQVFHFNP